MFIIMFIVMFMFILFCYIFMLLHFIHVNADKKTPRRNFDGAFICVALRQTHNPNRKTISKNSINQQDINTDKTSRPTRHQDDDMMI